MTKTELIEYYEKRLEDQRIFYENENTAAIAAMQEELDKARRQRSSLMRQIERANVLTGKPDPDQDEVIEELLKLIRAGHDMMTLQKANESNETLQAMWKQYMMTLRMTGNDGTV